MKTLAEKISSLNALVLAGKSLEAFDLFYHAEVSMQENENAPVVGKEANRTREIAFYSSVTGFQAVPLAVAVGESVTMVKWHYDYDHKDWGRKNYTQVSVQHWEDGKIIREQYFYGN